MTKEEQDAVEVAVLRLHQIAALLLCARMQAGHGPMVDAIAGIEALAEHASADLDLLIR